MEKEQRNAIQRAVKDARNLLEGDFGSQLLEVFDIDVAKARVADGPGSHLDGEQRFLRSKLTAAIAHKQATSNDLKEALLLFRREMAFTALNRFVALKLMEARALVHECVSQGLQSSGFEEFTGLAPALLADPEGSYQLFLQCLFEDVSREVKVLFDPRDPASLLWPRRASLLELLEILNRPELAELWSEDETIGWVYQYFNSKVERQEMRRAAAPRNSRELAVRNQFFTPRYVVEFLTDNTLGRIWYEMRHGDTGLKERCRYLVHRPNEIFLAPGESLPDIASDVEPDTSLSQEELLQQPVHIPYRMLKDPRQIRLLDPACGSMHFGLYAFDLFIAIYEEAWEITQRTDKALCSAESFANFGAYASSFTDKAAFLREVPRLILEHNLHGIDIDPRAVQIAGLSLWLRAQRAWQQAGVFVAERPCIRRSNVVCAEPMPGEKDLLQEFVERHFPVAERPAFTFLLETIVEAMTLAGEAGILLRIEEDIRSAIAEAKRLWKQLPSYEQPSFLVDLNDNPSQGEIRLDLSGITDEQFWHQAEQRIYTALERFANEAENTDVFRRRLFSEDASYSFALIDLCSKRFDAVVTNPPFGEAPIICSNKISGSFPDWNANILCAFIERGLEMLTGSGRLGAIFDRTVINKSTYSDFRKHILLSTNEIDYLLDLGWDVLDANVETTSMLFRKGQLSKKVLCLDARTAPDKAGNLFKDLRQLEAGSLSNNVSIVDRRTFYHCPNYVIGYDFPRFLLDAFARLPSLEKMGLRAYSGHTLKADRHNRVWWETSYKNPPGFVSPMFNGSGYSPYSTDFREVAIAPCSLSKLPRGSSMILRNIDVHQRPGLCFSKRGEFLCVHIAPAGLIFTQEGRPLPVPDGSSAFWLMGYLNTPLIRFSINKYCGQHKTSGYINLLPLDFAAFCDKNIDLKLKTAYQHHQALRSRDETQPIFAKPLSVAVSPLPALVETLRRDLVRCQIESKETEDLCDSRLRGAYKLTCQENDLIERYRETQPSQELPIDDASLGNLDFFFSTALISESVGFNFGRWDIRYSTGERLAPEQTDPFKSLPVCPPGMLQGDDCLPLSPNAGKRLRAEGLYPLDVAWDGTLVDDPEHPLDIERRVQAALSVIWGDQAEELSQEACTLLGVSNLREWFRRPPGFFADHLKRYSKSRRQAPIYWLLSAGSGSYSVWLYYHRFTADRLYRVLQDYVDPRISQAERDCFKWQQQVASGGTTGAAQQLQSSQALLEDLKQLKAEISLVAPLWKPDLNDGVIINHAILWRITPYAPWQKKVKECWDKLVDEEYDWAHLAFHLWPERVIPKCATDRSLAIAHGLDATFWCENQQGKWEPIPHSEEQLAQVVAAHTNHARRNDLQRFLAAPPPVAVSRARTPLFAKSASSGTRRSPRTTQSLDPELIRQVRLVLTAGPPEGMAKATIAELGATEDAQLTAVIKQLKESGQIEQLGQKRGARYRLSPAGLAATEAEGGLD
jgi:hypothetical protein